MYFVLIEDRAANDIQDHMDYYDGQLLNLGEKFKSALDKELSALAKNPFYQIRYNSIRCKPIKNWPFLIHFQVDESQKIVYVFAVINTNKDPKSNWLK